MSMDVPVINNKKSLFIQEAQGKYSSEGVKRSYVNINDIANLRQVGADSWIADSMSKQKDSTGEKLKYNFDNQGANQILNYIA